MQHIQHLIVISIFVFVYGEHLLRITLNLRLVEHAEHPLKSVVHIATQSRNLHNNAVVGKTLHKGLLIALGYGIAVIVVNVMIDVHDWIFDIAHLVTKQIDSHHGIGKTFPVGLLHIVPATVLCTKILTETQHLRVEPCLLQFNQNDTIPHSITFAFTDRRGEINAEHRQRVTRRVAVFMRTNRYMNHFFFQQSRQHRLGYALILHEIFEHGVVYRVGYMYDHNTLIYCIYKSR